MLQNYVFEVPCEVGLAIIDALLVSIPRHGAGKGKGKHQVNTRSRTRNWNTFHRQLSGLRPALVLDSATRITHGPPPSAEWASLVAGLHPASPGDFARSHGDGVCDQWPSPGVWLNRACRVSAGRAVVTPSSVMDPETWAAYIAHNIKCILMGSVFPAMACASQYMLRGFVNDEEKGMFWLAVDAATLDVDCGDQYVKHDTDGTWKGRLVWTIKTDVLQNAPTQRICGRDLWFRGCLRLLTSAPRTQGGMSRIKFDPSLQDDETGDVTMLVLDFAGVPLWQYSCLKKVAQDPVTGPLAGLMRWANQPTIASPSNVFKGTFQDTDILSSLPEKLRCLDEEQLSTIRGISRSDAPIQFIHALAGTGKTHVLKCLLHGWNRIRGPGAFVVVALRTRELREEMWRDLQDILPEDSLMTVGQPPSPPAGSTAPQRYDAPAERFDKLVICWSKIDFFKKCPNRSESFIYDLEMSQSDGTQRGQGTTR